MPYSFPSSLSRSWLGAPFSSFAAAGPRSLRQHDQQLPCISRIWWTGASLLSTQCEMVRDRRLASSSENLPKVFACWRAIAIIVLLVCLFVCLFDLSSMTLCLPTWCSQKTALCEDLWIQDCTLDLVGFFPLSWFSAFWFVLLPNQHSMSTTFPSSSTSKTPTLSRVALPALQSPFRSVQQLSNSSILVVLTFIGLCRRATSA
mmetsp:Transcript_3619/g.5045  ORF Transcript_3619/g.5045 Transcript_3619/m.5045 type:complete len:203 (+) Transcript_3619:328-936(+)